MYTRLAYKLSGILSIITGIFCCLSIYQARYLFYGVSLSIIGFILSGINIYLNNKYEFDEKKWPKGYIGMLLNSVPVLFMLFLTIKYKK